MKLFSKIRRGLNRLPRQTIVTFAVIGLLAGAVAPVLNANMRAAAEFYPNRTPFDYNKPCNPNDADIYDRCGSLTGPVFNSFINTPSYGDERAFLDARRTDQTAAGSYENVLRDVNMGSQEVVVRMYVHNNANQSTNDSGLGIARNARVRVAVPTGTANTLRARGYIWAQNANMVEDTVDFVGTEEIKVSYVPGSAVLYDNDNFKNGVALSDSIVTNEGALIGTDALDGNLKGCFEYEAVVQLRLKVTPQTPKTDFMKQVALAGQTQWGESVNVKPGDKVKWLISFSNKGNVDMTNVTISDKLPPHLQLVSGSVQYVDAAQTTNQNDTALFNTGGINFSTWKPNGGFYVRFETTAQDNFEGCEVTIRNIAYNDSDQTDRREDHADVKITKPNCVTTTTKPRELPKAGAGSVVGLFAATTTVGAVAHRIFTGRKYNR